MKNKQTKNQKSRPSFFFFFFFFFPTPGMADENLVPREGDEARIRADHPAPPRAETPRERLTGRLPRPGSAVFAPSGARGSKGRKTFVFGEGVVSAASALGFFFLFILVLVFQLPLLVVVTVYLLQNCIFLYFFFIAPPGLLNRWIEIVRLFFFCEMMHRRLRCWTNDAINHLTPGRVKNKKKH
jgi:hypothetical protein